MNRIKLLKQRGDTIVEVLIAMAVLGIVLASAFAIANRSYAVGISAQERTEALKIAQSQVELIRLASNSTDNAVLNVDSNLLFCIDPSGSSITPVKFELGATVQETNGDVDPIRYPTDGSCSFGVDNRYSVSIEKSGESGEIYSVRVRWPSVLGGIINEVNHVYRTYDFEGSFSLTSQVVASTICEDPTASNYNLESPCEFLSPPPPPPTSPLVEVDNTSNSTVLSWNHTISAGEKRKLIVSVMIEASSASSNNTCSVNDARVTSLSYGGTPLIHIADADACVVSYQGSYNLARVEMWYLDIGNSALIETKQITANLSGSPTAQFFSAISFKNVASGLPLAAKNTNTNNQTITTSINVGALKFDNALLVDAVLSGVQGNFIDGAQTEVFDSSNYTATGAMSYKENLVSNTYQMTQNFSSTTNRMAHSVLLISPINTSIPSNLVDKSTYGGSQYYLSDESVTWSQANAAAAALGGHLATPTTAGENTFIANFANGPLLWIGLSDLATEGTWKWVTGEPFSYSNWSTPVQPDNYTYGGAVPAGEDNVMIYTSGSGKGKWNDLPAWDSRRYIVEFD